MGEKEKKVFTLSISVLVEVTGPYSPGGGNGVCERRSLRDKMKKLNTVERVISESQ